MRVALEQNVIDDIIIETVLAADRCGEPVWVPRGPRYEKDLKHQFHVSLHPALPRLQKTHQSVISSRVKQLVDQGFLRFESGEVIEDVLLGSKEPVTRQRETLVLLPA